MPISLIIIKINILINNNLSFMLLVNFFNITYTFRFIIIFYKKILIIKLILY